MKLRKFKTPGLAQLSYAIASEGEVVVIDPRRDVDAYLDFAKEEEARIRVIFETHRNEDLVSGGKELAARTGATVLHGAALDFEYGESVRGGEKIDLGKVCMQVLQTPGHTDESLSITLADTEFSKEPIAVFTGDALFVGDVGRTDFYPDRAEEVARLLYESLHDTLLPLGDHVAVHPAHGAGSVCGDGMADREFTTLGYERRFNPMLQRDQQEFVASKLAERHDKPPYFERMEAWNKAGPPELGSLPRPTWVPAGELVERIDSGLQLLDVRRPEAFAGAHIKGSYAIPLDMLAAWAGWILDPERPIGLVVESTAQLDEATRALVRVGYDDVAAALRGGMAAWETSGRELGTIPVVSVHELAERRRGDGGARVLDVRPEREFEDGHLDGAMQHYVARFAENPNDLPDLPRDKTVTTFCGSGRRALIAAALLRRQGFESVEVCLGSMKAWKAMRER